VAYGPRENLFKKGIIVSVTEPRPRIGSPEPIRLTECAGLRKLLSKLLRFKA
jgi:hypothetical protein